MNGTREQDRPSKFLGVEWVTFTRDTWLDAGKKRTDPYLEDKHLDAGIGFTFDKLYHFQFKTRYEGRWIQRKGFKTADDALKAYNRLIDAGVIPVTLR